MQSVFRRIKSKSIVFLEVEDVFKDQDILLKFYFKRLKIMELWSKPKLEGKRMTMFIAPKKKK